MEHISCILNDMREQLDHYEVAESDFQYMNKLQESKRCGEKAALLKMWVVRLEQYEQDFITEYENA